MPVINRFRHYDLDQADRRTLNIASFGGVDLSSQRFNVASSRAIDSQNFYYKDGVIQVREGFEELYDVLPIEYIARDFDTGNAATVVSTNTVDFNGIWRFEAEDGQFHVVAHIGKLLFEIKNIGTNNISILPLKNDNATGTIGIKTRPLYYEFLDKKSFAFVGAKKLWFLGGNKYMVIRFTGTQADTIHAVENGDNTFIPKTTIGITYTNAKVSGRESLDYPNMLNIFRRNTLVSGIGKDEDTLTETKYFEYRLDAPIYLKDTEDDFATQPTTQSDLSTDTKKALGKIKILIDERGVI